MSFCFLRSFLITAGLLAALPVPATEAARAAIEALVPDAAEIRVVPSPLPGISEVVVDLTVFYVSNDGRYILGGPLVRTADQRNLTEPRVAAARAELLGAQSEVRTFDYPAPAPAQTLTIVTDIDCPYCRRLHNDMDGYNAAGFDVRYIMLPRAGRDSASYRKAVYAACADDPEAAMTDAMNGKTPPEADCDHPIDRHMEIAQQLRIGSTPSIVFEDGRLLRGLRSPAELKALAVDTGAD